MRPDVLLLALNVPSLAEITWRDVGFALFAVGLLWCLASMVSMILHLAGAVHALGRVADTLSDTVKEIREDDLSDLRDSVGKIETKLALRD